MTRQQTSRRPETVNEDNAATSGRRAWPAGGAILVLALAFSPARADIPVNFISQWGGPTHAVTVVGNRAYIGVGHRLTILDITDPATPTAVGRTNPLADLVEGVAVAGGYAYVADSLAGLLIIDISNEQMPVQVGAFDTNGIAEGVAVAGDYAYVADHQNGLEIINISSPTTPSREGGYDTSGEAYQVAIAGNYAYVADGMSGLQIINVSTPATPTPAGSLTLPGSADGIALAAPYAYVADDSSGGLQVIDVSDPTNPQVAGSCSTHAAALDVTVVGDYAYVANAWAGVAIIDIGTPSNPVMVNNLDTSGWTVGIAASGGLVLLADSAVGIEIIDVSAPPTATQVGQYRGSSGEVTDLDVSGSHVYLSDGGTGGGVQVLDITNPAAPVRLNGIETHEFAWGMTLSGSFVYLADGCAGLGIVDVTDPANPNRRGEAATDCAARDAVVNGENVYVALDNGHGLAIVNILDPDAPVVAGHWEDTANPGYALGVAVNGPTAYLADNDQGLQIINVTDPANPTRLGRFETGGLARDVAVSGAHAYVADEWLGLVVVDVSDPEHPSLAGRCDTFGNGQGVTLSGQYAYVAAAWDGLQIVDISDPTHPLRVGHYDTPGYARRTAVAGTRIYVADYNNGLVILDQATNGYYWSNPDGGDFIISENWTPSGPPGASDRAIFDLPASYATSMPADADVVNDRLLVNDGTVQIDLNQRTYTLQHTWDGAPSVTISDDATGATSASLSVYNGAIVAKELELGRWPDNEGFLGILGISWTASGSFFDIGVFGRGEVWVDGSTVSHQNGWLAFGPDSVGVLMVSYGGIWDTTDEMVVGRAGTGTMTIEESSASYVGRCILGELGQGSATRTATPNTAIGPHGTGTITVQTSGTLDVTRSNETSLIVGKGGEARLTVRSGGAVQNAGMLHIAEENGSSGHLELRHVFGSGGQVTSNYQFVAGLNGGEGTVDVDGAGSQLSVLGRDPGNPDDIISLELGRNGGHGVMNVTGGGRVDVPFGGAPSTGGVSIGGTGPGELTVDGPDSVFDAQFWMDVGRDAPGQLTVRNGGHLLLSGTAPEGGFIWIGARARGDATVTGSGSQLNAISQMTVGDADKGTLIISDQATARCGTLLLGGYDLPTTDGEVTVTGSGSSLTTELCRVGGQGPGRIQLTAGAGMTNSSQAQIGYQGSGSLDITSAGLVDSHKGASPTGTSGILGSQPGSTGIVTVSGPGSFWTHDGVLNVGWFGAGTMNVESSGNVESVNGVVARAAGSTGTVTVTELNSKWAVSEALSVGGLMDTAGGTGTLSVTDNGLVTVGSALRVWAGSSVSLSAGRAVVGSGAVPAGQGVLALYPGGTVSGTGTLTANVVNSGGTLAPGTSPGTLQVNGYYIQSGAGSITVEIGGSDIGQFDKLVVNGSATLGGALNITLTGGFVAVAGNTFEIVHATTRAGTFTQTRDQHAASGLRFLPSYTATSVILTVAPTVPPDFDEDGDVDSDDLALFTPCFGRALVPYPPGCAAKNLDGDTDVDLNDFGIFQRCQSGSNQPASAGCAN